MKPITLKPHQIRCLKSTGEVLVVRALEPQPCYVNSLGIPFLPGVVVPVDYRLNPIGKPGDRLWVREVWYAERTRTRLLVNYRADGDEHNNWYDRGFKWLSPVVMPKEASRFTVEVDEVVCKKPREVTEREARQATGTVPPGWSTFVRAFEYYNPTLWYQNPFCWFVLLKVKEGA